MTTQPPKLLGKDAVLQGLPDHPAVQAVVAAPDKILDIKYEFGELTFTVAAGDLRAACHLFKDAGYNFFEDMTAVDWFPSSPRFQLSYHLFSTSRKDRIRLRAMLEEADPVIDTITNIWAGANFFEREVFDLFGIRFAEHPDLRRIMMPDDWQGHPLRKDYPVEGYR